MGRLREPVGRVLRAAVQGARPRADCPDRAAPPEHPRTSASWWSIRRRSSRRPAMLRRLTRTQFRNALKDVFGYAVDISNLDADSWDSNFATRRRRGGRDLRSGGRAIQHGHRKRGQRRVLGRTKRGQFIGCTPTGQSTTPACAASFRSSGCAPGAGRSPARSSIGSATLAASASTTLGSAIEGARWATVALFESPNFLYRPELGAAAAERRASFQRLRDGRRGCRS